MSVSVLVTFDLDPALVERITAVAPNIEVGVLGVGARARFPGRIPYPSELQAATPPEELLAALPDAEVLFASWAAGPLPAMDDLAARAPRLRWVQLTHAGAERVRPEPLAAGITFTTAAGLASTPVAEYVLAYLLLFTKGWPALWRQQQTHTVVRSRPGELHEATVGIVGLGAIGSEVARLAKAFGCRVLAVRRSSAAAANIDELLPPSALHTLLANSHYVVLSAPLTEETRGLIGPSELSAMRPDAVLINVSRGGLVNEPALIDALRAGRIRGAALDVFASEPLLPDSPLWDIENVVLTPHIAAGTDRYYERATKIFCANLARYLAGKPLEGAVDRTRGY